MFRKIGILIFTFFTKIALFLHKPKIIAITGSVGKTTTKSMINNILSEAGLKVRSSYSSFNSEFGVPFGLLGIKYLPHNLIKKIGAIFVGFFNIFFNFPKIVVLETGVDRKGDMENILKLITPDIAILTKLAKTPVHLENFSSKEDLYNEKFALVESANLSILNYDDPIQVKKSKSLNNKFITIGQQEDNDLVLTYKGVHLNENGFPIGTDLRVMIAGKEETFYIPEAIGDGVVYPALQSIAVGIHFSIPIEEIRKSLVSLKPEKGRARILKGVNNNFIVDGSYNSSPTAVKSVVDFLSNLENKKKIAVLGEMAELGDQTQQGYKEVLQSLENNFDLLILVGNLDIFKKTADKFNIETILFNNKTDAITYIKQNCKDAILFIKGSQNASRMELILEEILDESIDPKETLVRQELFWKI